MSGEARLTGRAGGGGAFGPSNLSGFLASLQKASSVCVCGCHFPRGLSVRFSDEEAGCWTPQLLAAGPLSSALPKLLLSVPISNECWSGS